MKNVFFFFFCVEQLQIDLLWNQKQTAILLKKCRQTSFTRSAVVPEQIYFYFRQTRAEDGSFFIYRARRDKTFPIIVLWKLLQKNTRKCDTSWDTEACPNAYWGRIFLRNHHVGVISNKRMRLFCGVFWTYSICCTCNSPLLHGQNLKKKHSAKTELKLHVLPLILTIWGRSAHLCPQGMWLLCNLHVSVISLLWLGLLQRLWLYLALRCWKSWIISLSSDFKKIKCLDKAAQRCHA